MRPEKKTSFWKKWWVWASIGVIILSVIVGEDGSFGFKIGNDAALDEAEECLRYGAYSYAGLIEELSEYRGFTETAAVWTD